MALLGPEFIDVTWNAGGVTSDLTIEICSNAQTVYGLETNMHLTCTNMPVEKIDHALIFNIFFFLFFFTLIYLYIYFFL